MAGYTLEQLKQMGAKPVAPTKPQGFTLEELQARGLKPKTPEVEKKETSYWGSFIGKGRLKENVESSAQMRAEKIKESIASSDSGLKKTIDIGAQIIAGGLFDPAGNIISAVIPKWVKDRFAKGVEKSQEPVRKIMEEKGYIKTGEEIPSITESISSAIGKKIDEPTQYMIESQKQMFEQAQQIMDRAFAESNPEKKKLLEETARGMETAVQEINKSIQETQKRRESLARSTESTEILGNVALMGTPKTAPTAKTQLGKTVDLTLDEADGIWKTLTKSTPEQLEQQMTKFYSKAVKPSVAGKMTIPQANKAIGNQIVAISLINKNIPKLKFIENGMEVIGRTPESMQELAEAVSQTKADIFTRYNSLATGANQKGATVNLNSIADELEQIANNPVVRDNAGDVAKYAQNLANTYRARGEYDVITSQEVIKLYNEKLQAFYRSPSPDYTTKAVVDSMVVNKMRELADSVIEKAEGAGYAELKKQYGALKSIEKEVVHRAIIEARKNSKGLLDFVDIASGAQVINWVVTGNAGALLQAGGMKAIAEYYKYLNSVNYNLRKMFEATAKLQKNAGKTAPKSKIIESIKNPSAGMSIQRVNNTQPQKAIQKSTQPTKTSNAKVGATAQSIKNTSNLSIPKSTTQSSLLQEAKKYKSAEEFVKAQTNAYHGTPNKEFSEFKLDTKRNTENETNGLGVWVTNSPEAAKTFSSKIENGMFSGSVLKDVGGTVMPVSVQLKNPKIYTSTKGMESILDDIEKLRKQKPSIGSLQFESDPTIRQEIIDKRDIIDKQINKLKKEYQRDAFEHFMDDRDQFAQYIQRGAKWEDRYIAEKIPETNKQFIDYLKKQGHDGIIIKGTKYDAKRSGLDTIDQIVSFEPSKVLTKSQLTDIWKQVNKK